MCVRTGLATVQRHELEALLALTCSWMQVHAMMEERQHDRGTVTCVKFDPVLRSWVSLGAEVHHSHCVPCDCSSHLYY